MPEEKMLVWELCQDMLPVGIRIHRSTAERRCLTMWENEENCTFVQDRDHCFRTCDVLGRSYLALVNILEKFLDRKVEFKDVLHLNLTHRKLKKILVAI